MSKNTQKSVGCFVDPPKDGPYEFKSICTIDYRSLYPEPFELVLQEYKLNIETLLKYKLNYSLVQEIFNKKMDDYEFQLIKAEFTKIVKEIIELEK